MNTIVRIAHSDDHQYAASIADEMNLSASKRGTGISLRTPEYIIEKIDSGLAVIALNADSKEWIGFCSIEVWDHQRYIANTGLIISSKYRGNGFSKDIKEKLFDLERKQFPRSTIFSLTTCPAVIHINAALGYKKVNFGEVMNDPWFHQGCHSWVNYVELMRKGPESGYVAMVYVPEEEAALLPLWGSRLLGKLKRLRKSKRAHAGQRQLVPQLAINR